MSVPDLIGSLRLLICVGSGGVGKTTTAAAIGLQAASQGRKVLVLTIDPARRLANSLCLNRFGNDETRIDLAGLGMAEAEARGGQLWAMMLDNQQTFDDLIKQIAPNTEARDRILENRIYRATADNISGSQEYMATEKLYDVVGSRRYDLVVLDTPPVKNALDFLDAPGRLARFLDKRVMKWFLTPYDEQKVFGKLLMGTSAVAFRLLGHVFGKEFLEDLSVYFHLFRDLYDGFRERQEAVVEMFNQPTTAFLVVCAPTEPSLEVAGFFLDELARRGMPNPGVVVNQRHLTRGEALDPRAVLGAAAAEAASDLPPHTASQLLARLGAAHKRLRELSVREDQLITERLRVHMHRRQLLWSIPRFEEDVHDLPSLARMGSYPGRHGTR
jgi:anion-transporting  ArsA/GET3 family ATPase